MALTQKDKQELFGTRARIAGSPDPKKGDPKTDKELEDFLKGSDPVVAPTKLNPWAHMAIGPKRVVALVKRFHPTVSKQFTDSEIASYALNYTDDSVGVMVRMVGFHMKDRIEKRKAGSPSRDDSKGQAAAKAAAEARAAAAEAELEELG